MRFLLDESVDVRLALYLRQQGHDVTAIAIDYQASLTDEQVIALAHAERRILITNDRDFGELVFVGRRPHVGVILLRLDPQATLPTKIERLHRALTDHADELSGFLVVTSDRVRIR